MKKLPCCPHPDCSKAASVIRHGFYKTRSGKRRRYLCQGCGKTFCLTKGTPHYRLQHRRSTFDDVASLSVEGLSKSAISRVKSIAWNTVDRWLEMVAACCRRFSDQSILGLDIRELQADEIRTISGGKSDVIWIFATIDVWSRLWPSAVIGRRSYGNTLALIRDTRSRMRLGHSSLLVVTGEFEFYETAVRRIFGPMCLYAQVLKTRRNNRVIRVERRPVIGASSDFEYVLSDSEDSATLNTSFVERLNLTIRQGSAYLTRLSLSYARRTDRLADHIELLRCHYNFLRPHRALKFGAEIPTPAMQAGLTSRRMTFREVFSWKSPSICLTMFAVRVDYRPGFVCRAA